MKKFSRVMACQQSYEYQTFEAQFFSREQKHSCLLPAVAGRHMSFLEQKYASPLIDRFLQPGAKKRPPSHIKTSALVAPGSPVDF